MKPYTVTYKFYYNGELLNEDYDIQLRTEPRSEEIAGDDFQGLLNLKMQYGSIIPITIWARRKGKVLYLLDAWNGIKEWKNDCKPWKLVISSKETTVSMKRLMQFDSDKVIQYLKERGITTCPMNF